MAFLVRSAAGAWRASAAATAKSSTAQRFLSSPSGVHPTAFTLHRCPANPPTLRLSHITTLPPLIPARWNAYAGLKIKAKDESAPSTPKPAPAAPQSERSEHREDDASDAQGLDLFAQAALNQKRREAQANPMAAAAADLDPSANPGEGTGAPVDPLEAERQRKWKEEAEKEQKKQMAKTYRFLSGSLLAVAFGSFIYLGLPDDSQKPKEGESLWTNYHVRAWENFKKLRTTLAGHGLEKLLPDAFPPPYSRPLTLCIELTDALVHLEWDKSVGWRVATRPGVKQFLANLSRTYEVVIFTNSPGYLADPVCVALDPYFFYAMYRLYRDHTTLVDGHYVKDLSQLNRDLSKTIILDIDPASYQLQPENGLFLKPWTGDRSDRELKKIETFLEELFVFMTVYDIQDVRPILNIVNTIDPTDPAKAWAEYKQRVRADFESRNPSSAGNASSTSSRSFIGRLFGGGAGVTQQQPQSMNVIDQIERIAAEEHAIAEKDAENMKEQMTQMQREQEEAIKKQVEDNKKKGLKLWDYVNGAGGAPPPQ
ncbi:mitochondrial inner membrane protein required for protein import [Geranomyces michiganensis]|nr:mitochondrial inner membrane protein required for protein import [Geranomyces michiganensis]